MPLGTLSAGRKRRRGDREQRRRSADFSSDEDTEHVRESVVASSSKHTLTRKRSRALSRSPSNAGSGQDEDVFHLDSHPVASVSSDEFTLVAQEADLLPLSASAQQRDEPITWSGTTHDGKQVDIRTGRFDVLHLLSTLPAGATLFDAGAQFVPCASTAACADGMEDLPSDAEDMFYLEAEEVEVYRRQKQQKRLEALRQARLDALQAQDESDHDGTATGSVAIPAAERVPITQDQLDLMQRTAHALRDASNRATLEMRILANHGNDARFAFLRRRQSGDGGLVDTVWRQLLAGKTLTLSEANAAAEAPQRISVALVAYDSGSDSDKETAAEEMVTEDPEARRQRKLALAREWTLQRKAQRNAEAKPSTIEDIPPST